MELGIINHVLRRTKTEENNEKIDSIKSNGIKRCAEQSPRGEVTKRPVFGDITNQTKKVTIKNDTKNLKTFISNLASKSKSESSKEGIAEKLIVSNDKILTKESEIEEPNVCQDGSKVKINLSRMESEDSVMYTTAVEEISPEEKETKIVVKSHTSLAKPLPLGVEDFDKANEKDIYNESRYVTDIFAYYKEKERLFLINKYMSNQTEMNRGMRAILVDWMVEVQESFELNHETLYLAVKLVDVYLMNHFVPKTELQLIGATATFVAAKYDERIPPLVDDFLYICDDSYSREQLIRTEIKMLKTIDFSLGIPLSYRFLRRYARCARISMELLTLARYILEISLMDYELIDAPDSKIAAAALLLALKMKGQEWTPTLCHYSTYEESELTELMTALNKNISAIPSRHLKIIRTKYSHEVFFEVAKIPPLNLKDSNS